VPIQSVILFILSTTNNTEREREIETKTISRNLCQYLVTIQVIFSNGFQEGFNHDLQTTYDTQLYL